MATDPNSDIAPPLRRISLTWPALLIVIGALLLADQFIPAWGIGKTWPLVLVVLGVVRLIESGRPPRPPRGPQV